MERDTSNSEISGPAAGAVESPPHRILVVDDEPAVARALSALTHSFGHVVDVAESVESAIAQIAEHDYDVVLTDVQMGPTGGFDLLKHVRTHSPRVPVVMITGAATIDAAMAAIQAGAYDYLAKPLQRDQLGAVLGRAIERKKMAEQVDRLQRHIRSDYDLADVAGRSSGMLEVFKTVAHVAPGRSSILILGESGTGKELVARALHSQSPRARKSFIPVNLAAVPDTLLESELFGHQAGAFTGATQSRRGLFQEAHEGTLFLDEIGDLSLPLQAKLLRAIQEQRIKPVGADEEVPVDVRVVAATHRDLDAMVKTGLFREDLYYRLNVVSIRIPPLRERRDDIPILVEHFLMKYQATGRTAPRISDAAIEMLRRYRWPGNVRELENAVERALLLCKDGLITPDLLPAGLDVEPVDSATDSAPEWVPLDDMIETYVARVIEHAGGNLSHASRILGVSRRTLQRMAERRRRTGEPGDSSSHSATD